jgi:hypothetical protein
LMVIIICVFLPVLGYAHSATHGTYTSYPHAATTQCTLIYPHTHTHEKPTHPPRSASWYNHTVHTWHTHIHIYNNPHIYPHTEIGIVVGVPSHRALSEGEDDEAAWVHTTEEGGDCYCCCCCWWWWWWLVCVFGGEVVCVCVCVWMCVWMCGLESIKHQ